MSVVISNGTRIAGLSTIVVGLAGATWFWLETTPPRLGFDDTDDPSVSLQFLEGHSVVYAQAGLALFVMGIALIIATFAVSDTLAQRASSLALRVVTTIGLFSAAFVFMHGVLRFGVLPLLYVDGLRHEWGQAAYLVSQFAGIHGFAAGGIVTLCLWAVGISLIGFRTRALPIALCALGVVAGFRLLSILGPFGVSADGLWILFLASIPGVMLWCLALGVVLLLRRAPSADPASSGAPATA